MNKIVSKENQKKLIIMIVIIMLFNFVMPNYSQAGFIKRRLLNFFARITLVIPDALLEGLQAIFVGDEFIKNDKDVYSIKLSPGTIFAGKIPWFNANFIKETEGTQITTWVLEPVLETLIDNDRCYSKELVTKFDISNHKRTIKKSACTSR